MESLEASGKQLQDIQSEQASDKLQIFRVHQKYGYVETEIKLLHKGENINLLVRPFKNDSTKVIMWVNGK